VTRFFSKDVYSPVKRPDRERNLTHSYIQQDIREQIGELKYKIILSHFVLINDITLLQTKNTKYAKQKN